MAVGTRGGGAGGKLPAPNILPPPQKKDKSLKKNTYKSLYGNKA